METACFIALVALVALAIGEAVVRLSGLCAVPLYQDDPAGYRMRGFQEGRFFGRNAWRYDRFGMRSDHAVSALDGLTLLVGDSVVDGGVHLDQAQSLAAQLEAVAGCRVYPVACGGWSLANELAALVALPGWNRAERLIFVLNSGDFEGPARLGECYACPTRAPRLHLPWLALRLLARGRAAADAEAWPHDHLVAQFATMIGAYSGPVWIVRYPRRGEDLCTAPLFDRLEQAAGPGRIGRITLAGRSDWGQACYRDHIHPNALGTARLARAIAEGVF